MTMTLTHRERSSRDFPRMVISLPGLRLVGFNILGIKNWFGITNIYDVENEDKSVYSEWVKKKFDEAPEIFRDKARLLEVEGYQVLTRTSE